MTLGIAAGLGVGLELALQYLDLLLGQTGTRQVLCVFVEVHDGLMIVVDHLHRGVWVHVSIHWGHHGRRHHGRVVGEGVVHRQTRMARVIPWRVDVTHDVGRED